MKLFKTLNIMILILMVLLLSTTSAFASSKNQMASNVNKSPVKVTNVVNKKVINVVKVNKAKTIMVKISNFAFNSSKIVINKGDTVIWTNMDSMAHTVTSKSFASGNLNMNATFKFTFNNPGTFDYVCSYHPSMTGTVIVK